MTKVQRDQFVTAPFRWADDRSSRPTRWGRRNYPAAALETTTDAELPAKTRLLLLVRVRDGGPRFGREERAPRRQRPRMMGMWPSNAGSVRPCGMVGNGARMRKMTGLAFLTHIDLNAEIERFLRTFRADGDPRRCSRRRVCEWLGFTMRAGAELHEHVAPGPITLQPLRGRFALILEDDEREIKSAL